MVLIYVAHPIRPEGNRETVAYNVVQARHFFCSALLFGLPVVAPYLLLLAMGWTDDADDKQREAGLKLMETIASRCDAVALCGPRASAGMIRERNACGIAIDCLSLSPEEATQRINQWVLSQTS